MDEEKAVAFLTVNAAGFQGFFILREYFLMVGLSLIKS